MRERIVLVLALSTWLAACTGDGEPVIAVRFLALGDSYTIGESVSTADRWPEQMALLLAEDGLAVDVEIVARTGWTTSELDTGIDAADPSGPYDLVTLLIGVNNQFRGLDPNEYRTEFAELLQRAIAFAGSDAGKVIVVSIPDWGVTPFAEARGEDHVAGAIDLFNEINHSEADRQGVAWVDVTAISRSGSPGLVADDGLHPSGVQYRQWAELIAPVAAGILGGE